jgi:hypothetical protein
MVECQLPKLKVAGSIPVTRSIVLLGVVLSPKPVGLLTSHR